MDVSRKVTIAVLSGLTLVSIAIAGGVRHWHDARQLNCQDLEGRGQEICASIERHLEFTCCGHAIVSPGFRSTWATVKNVWCDQQIEQQDATVLRALAATHDSRLVSAAESLLRLLTRRDQYGTLESETSIFHPENPSYLLKDGCPGTPAS